MKTTKAAARAYLNEHYPETKCMPLDWAIVEARRLYAVDCEYWRIAREGL